MDHSNEMNFNEFSLYMSDPIFQKVQSVGINGGEPSLIKELPKYVDSILTLPELKNLNIISNGFNKKVILQYLFEIYKKCKIKNINFHVSFSLDGYEKIHDNVRGIDKAFKKVMSTIHEVKKNQYKYCDSFDLGCTIVDKNIDYLIELDTFIKEEGYDIKYRLGIKNKRIESDKLYKNFSILYNHREQTAKEFFHYKMTEAKNENEKFKYFSIFFWLTSNVKKRLLGCSWKDEGITVDGKANIYYCAVESKLLGSLRENTGENIFFNSDNLNYRKRLVSTKCDECIHDYSGKIEDESKIIFNKYLFDRQISMQLYKERVSLL
jgi:sulfatase maturation enzyme AslB (radical SAM superfamily)